MITQPAIPIHDGDPLRADQRDLGVALQHVLVDLIDLSLLGKHAHWNVDGPNFLSVHAQLDELVDAWRRLSDDVAERAVTLGSSPDGQAGVVAETGRIDPLPGGPIADRDAIAAVAERLCDVIRRTRVAMGNAAVRDSVTEDLLIGVVATLEKQHWMLRAQTAGDGDR